MCALVLCASLVRLGAIPKRMLQPQVREQNKVINVNQATIEELKSLPFVGVVLARRIVEYRAHHGPFTDKKELRNIKGIGDKKLEVIKEFIALR